MSELQSPTPLRILVVDDEANIRITLSMSLETCGHKVTALGTGEEALKLAAGQVFDLLFLDLRLGTENGLDYIPRFLAQSPWIKIVVITAYASIETAVEAMRRGATDYLPKPFTPEQVELLAARVAEVRALEMRVIALRDELGASQPAVTFKTQNHAMRAALDMARRFAAGNTAILLQGEDGVGKRTLARSMHQWGPRRDAPFMITSARRREDTDLANELFGAPAANREKPGLSRLERCAGGTLYLDDVCALSPRLQFGLLQFIQTGSFEREGDYASVQTDTRIIAGMSMPAPAALEQNLIRQDLYYALTANTIEIPALRNRSEDIAPLANAFLAYYARAAGKSLAVFTRDALACLEGYRWPGNVRELQNIVQRATILTAGPDASITDFPPNLHPSPQTPVSIGDLVPLERIEEQHIRGVLAKTTSLELAGSILGIDNATLWRRRKKYGL